MYDYLIIGHGLAGAVLSHHMIDKGYKIIVVDNPSKNRTSSVAAGLYNPITGRKMVKTWMADELFKVLEPTYQYLEKKLNTTFLYKIGIYRPFVTIEEKNDWEGRFGDEKYKPYINRIAVKPSSNEVCNDKNGGLHLSQAGYLDIPTFINANKSFLTGHGAYQELDFQEVDLNIERGYTLWRQLSFKRVIFCTGIAAQNSNLFGWLPFTPVKGELMDGTFSTELYKIYNRGVFVIPLGSKKVRVGATYRNTFEDDLPEQRGYEELCDKMNFLVNGKFSLEELKAGIRPATKDRRPLIGKHPEYEHIYVFNGFGSKGVSMIPYFSSHFIEYLEEKNSLNEHVSINRYESLYYSWVDDQEGE